MYQPIVFCLDWNREGLLAAAMSGSSSFLFTFDTNDKKLKESAVIETSRSCRSCHFNPNAPNLLLLGTFSGNVVLFDCEIKEVKRVINVSQQRICVVKWHPQFDYLFACGSFDSNVYIYDIKYNGNKLFRYH